MRRLTGYPVFEVFIAAIISVGIVGAILYKFFGCVVPVP